MLFNTFLVWFWLILDLFSPDFGSDFDYSSFFTPQTTHSTHTHHTHHNAHTTHNTHPQHTLHTQHTTHTHTHTHTHHTTPHTWADGEARRRCGDRITFFEPGWNPLDGNSKAKTVDKFTTPKVYKNQIAQSNTHGKLTRKLEPQNTHKIILPLKSHHDFMKIWNHQKHRKNNGLSPGIWGC